MLIISGYNISRKWLVDIPSIFHERTQFLQPRRHFRSPSSFDFSFFDKKSFHVLRYQSPNAHSSPGRGFKDKTTFFLLSHKAHCLVFIAHLSNTAYTMDSIEEYVRPLRDFSKDSIRLITRCTKPDLKGALSCYHELFV